MSEHVTSIFTYTVVFVALMVLLALSVLTAEFDLGRWNLVVAMSISAIKTILVLLFFMHLLHSTMLTKLFTVAGILMFLVLVAITMSDYYTRDWKSAPEPIYLAPPLDRSLD